MNSAFRQTKLNVSQLHEIVTKKKQLSTVQHQFRFKFTWRNSKTFSKNLVRFCFHETCTEFRYIGRSKDEELKSSKFTTKWIVLLFIILFRINNMQLLGINWNICLSRRCMFSVSTTEAEMNYCCHVFCMFAFCDSSSINQIMRNGTSCQL